MSITTPICYIQGTDGLWRNISPIIITTDIGYGKNQPFMYVLVKISKQVFNSSEFWGIDGESWANLDESSKNSGQFSYTKPEIKNGISRMTLNTYGKSGDTVVVRVSDSDDGFIEYVCANPMYRAKNANLDSIFRIIHAKSSSGTPLYQLGIPVFKIDWYDKTLPAATIPLHEDGTTVENRYIQRITSATSSDINPLSTLEIHINYSNDEPVIEMISGTPSDFFRFISYALGNYDPTLGEDTFIIDTPLKYGVDMNSPELAISYQFEELQNIETIKSELKENNREVIMKVRPSAKCWDIIKYFGYLTLRTPFYYDKAYFVNYEQIGKQPSFWNYNGSYLDNLVVDYGIQTDFVYPSIIDFINDVNSSVIEVEVGNIVGITGPPDEFYIVTRTDPNLEYTEVNSEITMGISINLDQGEKYTVQTQGVTAENFEWNSLIADLRYRNEGEGLSSEYPDTTEVDWIVEPQFSRKEQAKLCALHRLIECYDPQDTIKYFISESETIGDSPIPSQIFTSIADFDSWMESQSSIPAGTIIHILIVDGSGKITTDEYLEWFVSSTMTAGGYWNSIVLPSERIERYLPYSLIGVLEDRQSAISIRNAPLAYVHCSYPQCVTELTWGFPEFQDSEKQVNDAESLASGAIPQGESDINISDKWASKLSIGNQTLSQIDEDFTGFTGIAIVKNRTAELYEIRGYDNGYIQAGFDSTGRIQGGWDGSQYSVTIDATGLTARNGINIEANGVFIDVTPNQNYSAEHIKFRNRDSRAVFAEMYGLVGTNAGLYLNGPKINLTGSNIELNASSSQGIYFNSKINSGGSGWTFGTQQVSVSPYAPTSWDYVRRPDRVTEYTYYFDSIGRPFNGKELMIWNLPTPFNDVQIKSYKFSFIYSGLSTNQLHEGMIGHLEYLHSTVFRAHIWNMDGNQMPVLRMVLYVEAIQP